MKEILVPTGPADLIDQIIVMQGKADAASETAKRAMFARRLTVLQRMAVRVLPDDAELDRSRAALVTARRDLVLLEAELRTCEARSDFGIAFVALSRAYFGARDDLECCKADFDAKAEQLSQVRPKAHIAV